jgi:hypothetical protein
MSTNNNDKKINEIENEKIDLEKLYLAQARENKGCGCFPIIIIVAVMYIGFHSIWKLPPGISNIFSIMSPDKIKQAIPQGKQ